MIQKIKRILLTFSAAITLAVPALVPAVAHAANPAEIQKNLCSGANLDLVNGNPDCKKQAAVSDFQDTLAKIINIISIIVGVVAVIMIIFGGFKYITSGGTAEKVTGAKNTILYGLIGLIIVALAQIIVKFVLHQATTATGS